MVRFHPVPPLTGPPVMLTYIGGIISMDLLNDPMICGAVGLCLGLVIENRVHLMDKVLRLFRG